MRQDTAVNIGIASNTVCPRTLAVDELDCSRPNARPRRPIGQGRQHPFGEVQRLIRGEEVAGLAVADQLAMATDARGDDDPLCAMASSGLSGVTSSVKRTETRGNTSRSAKL